MNKRRIKNVAFSFLTLAFTIILTSCEDTIYRPDEAYPDQLIYMPAAYGGFHGAYIINNVTDTFWNETPVPGAPSKYVVDLENRKFIVPLAVYRSGINNDGDVNVNITAVIDSVSSFNASSDFADELTLIPASEYVLPETVTINGGDDIAQFNLLIDLDFLLAGYDTEKFAISVNVSSPDRESNEELATTTVVVYSEILKATAAFSVDVPKASLAEVLERPEVEEVDEADSYYLYHIPTGLVMGVAGNNSQLQNFEDQNAAQIFKFETIDKANEVYRIVSTVDNRILYKEDGSPWKCMFINPADIIDNVNEQWKLNYVEGSDFTIQNMNRPPHNLLGSGNPSEGVNLTTNAPAGTNVWRLLNTKSPGGQTAELAFVNESSYAVGYRWDLGDGSESEEVSPTHTYNSGTYTVTLTAFGITGNSSNSVFSKTITIN